MLRAATLAVRALCALVFLLFAALAISAYIMGGFPQFIVATLIAWLAYHAAKP
jgi:hypothetical protein